MPFRRLALYGQSLRPGKQARVEPPFGLAGASLQVIGERAQNWLVWFCRACMAGRGSRVLAGGGMRPFSCRVRMGAAGLIAQDPRGRVHCSPATEAPGRRWASRLSTTRKSAMPRRPLLGSPAAQAWLALILEG
jgi:hypothetical protein